MKNVNRELRQILIDAIAKGKKDIIQEALNEIEGKVFRVRNFIDVMIAASIQSNPNSEVKVIYDFDPELREQFDVITQRVTERLAKKTDN